MNKGTLKFIIILVSMLFINIEAAHAGLVHKFRLYISHEFSNLQLFYLSAGLLTFSCLIYIVFSPLPIGKAKWSWFSYYSYNPARNHYQNKRSAVKRISGILKNAQ